MLRASAVVTRAARLVIGKAGLAHKYTKRCAAGLDPAALDVQFLEDRAYATPTETS
jgi:hypothetical protein